MQRTNTAAADRAVVFQHDEVGLAGMVEQVLAAQGEARGWGEEPLRPAWWRRIPGKALRLLVGAPRRAEMQRRRSLKKGAAWLRRELAGSAKPVLVYVVPFDIWALRTGGAQRIAGLAQALSREFHVYILTPTRRVRDFSVRRLGLDCRLLGVPTEPEFEASVKGRDAGAVFFAFADMVDRLPGVRRLLDQMAPQAAAWAFTHPTAWPVVRPFIRPGQAVLYDVHDDYGQFLQQAYGDRELERSRRLVSLECDVLKQVQVAACCTVADLSAVRGRNPDSRTRLLVVPNGVDVKTCRMAGPGEVRRNRLSAGLSRPMVTFMGAHHGPNREAADFISFELAPAFPQAVFVIMGLNSDAIRGRDGGGPGNNVVVTGPVPEKVKEAVMTLSEVALAPMRSGTGSSLKIPDYVAHGNIVVGTPIGLRGFEELTSFPSVMATDDVAGALAAVLARLEREPEACDEACRQAREWVETTLDWSVAAKPLVEAMREEGERGGGGSPSTGSGRGGAEGAEKEQEGEQPCGLTETQRAQRGKAATKRIGTSGNSQAGKQETQENKKG